MGRENALPNAAAQLLEVYNDFGGGLNTETANEQLSNREYPIFENVDMNGRGSARRRTGRINALTSFPSGNGQGLFPFFRMGQDLPDLIMAVGGQLYLVPATAPSITGESLSGAGPTYTFAHPWIQRGSVNISVSGTHQIIVDDPIDAPALSILPGESTMPIGTVSVAYSFTSTNGETKLSPVATIDISTGDQVLMDEIQFPTDVTGLKVYVSESTVNGNTSLMLSQTLTMPALVIISELPAAGASSPPTSNTASVATMNYAAGSVTFNSLPAQRPTSNYTYELEELPISGLSNGFQTTDIIEAVQYQNVLWIATGTNLVQYDGVIASTIQPYTPTNMEAIYTGLNALAPDPSAYIQDGSQPSGITVTGIGAENNPGAANVQNEFTCYLNKASSITSVDYQWQYKRSADTTWTTGLAWAQDAAGKTWKFTFPTAEPYDIQVQARDHTTNTDTSNTYILSSFTVNPTPATAPPSYDGIEQCTKIFVFWDRILLTGNPLNPTLMYISDLANPTYFPVTNTIDWDMGNHEPINALAICRNILIVFTKTTIQALSGQDPTTYKRQIVHPTYGAIAGGSVQVIDNNVYFLSQEGVFELAPDMFLTYFNVQRIDYPIRTELQGELDENACSMYYDNQYYLCIPSQKRIYRYYFDFKAWVRDTSDALNVAQMLRYGPDVYDLTQDGKLRKYDSSVYTDAGEVYTMKVQSKYLAFGDVFDYKKLKRVFILAKHYADHNVDFSVTVEADSAVVLQPEEGASWVDGSGAVNWHIFTSPNFHLYSGTRLGTWVLGANPLGPQEVSVQMAILQASKTRRTRITFEHTQPAACEIYGFGFYFRLRRPY